MKDMVITTPFETQARPLGLALALGAAALLMFFGWGVLAAMVAGHGEEITKLGPAMSLIGKLVPLDSLDPTTRAILAALCQSDIGARDFVSSLPVVLAMWAAMSLAMMIPTALPMLMAADGNGLDRLKVLGGYVTVWFAFSALAASLQIGLATAGLMDARTMVALSDLFGGAVLIGAGLYQFSALKTLCVTQCQVPHLVYDIAVRRGEGPFASGLRQGLLCVGCCWALMLVALAMGVMNLVWMAFASAIMLIEKTMATTRFSKAIGAVLILTGTVMVAGAVISRWPH